MISLFVQCNVTWFFNGLLTFGAIDDKKYTASYQPDLKNDQVFLNAGYVEKNHSRLINREDFYLRYYFKVPA